MQASSGVRDRQEHSRKRTLRIPRVRVGTHLVLLAVCVVMLVPFLWMLRTSLARSGAVFGQGLQLLPETFEWRNYVEAFTIVPFGIFMLNSLKVSVLIVIGQVITCTMAGYAFARLRFPGRDVLFVLVLATLMVPAQAILVPQYTVLRDLHLLNTHWALILPSLVSPFGVFLMRQYFVGFPVELEDAAKVDGASIPRFFLSIAFPMARPLLATLAVLAFVSSWGSFLAPLMFLTSPDLATVPLGLYRFGSTYATNWPALMAATTVSLLPSFVLYIFAQRYILDAYSMAGVQR